MKTQTIICPNCKADVNIEEAIYSQLQNEFENDFVEKREQYKKSVQDLKQREDLLLKQEEDSKVKIQTEVDKQLQLAHQELIKKQNDDMLSMSEKLNKEFQEKLSTTMKDKEQQLKTKLELDNQLKVKLLEDELQNKSKQLQELESAKVQIVKLTMEKEEIASSIKSQMQIQHFEEIKIEKQKALQENSSKYELQLKQKDESLRQVQDQLKIVERKAEQGSMQTQGEAQELAIEEYLTLKFPFDSIEEIKKGQSGADCLQIINTPTSSNCGTIYYESKRTKEFSKTWIEKFKNDMREKNADVGVLVTSVLPKGYTRMGFYDNIWVCTFDEFKGSVPLIRNLIIEVSFAKQTQEGKSDKMSLLYNFLTSNEFKMQVEAIVDGFTTMKNDLDKEKNAMNRIWKQREKQLAKVLDNTIGMYGSIKGIGGSAIASVPSLELGFETLEDE